GRFFHGYYDCYCYLPLYVFCGRHLLVARLRRADRDAADGALEEGARLVAGIRARWRRTRVPLPPGRGLAPAGLRDVTRPGRGRRDMENRIKECQLALFSERCGCSPNARQMRCTLDTETSIARDMPRELQCVAPTGALSSVFTITASMRSLRALRALRRDNPD